MSTFIEHQNWRYATKKFNSEKKVSETDLEILKDTDPNFKVFEPGQGMAGGRTSYFHKAIGGYSAVKPQRIQQLYDYQIANNNIQVLNMLNVKYVIQTTEEGQPIPLRNPDANGNAWFVENIMVVDSADKEIKALDSLDTKKTAVVHKEFYSNTKNNDFIKGPCFLQLLLVLYQSQYQRLIVS